MDGGKGTERARVDHHQWNGSRRLCVPEWRTLPEKEQEQFLFKDAAELSAAMEKLAGKPVVENALPPGKSRAELLAAVETTGSRLWTRIRDAHATRATKL